MCRFAARALVGHSRGKRCALRAVHVRARDEGSGTLSGNFGDSAALFANPVIAVALGLCLGVVTMLVSRRASRLVTPEDPFRGFLALMLVMGGKFLVVAAALTGYFMIAPGGLAAFGIALVLAFLASLVVEALRTSRLMSSRTSA
ncbi:MAG: hypothetical protein WBI63_09785 [Coriobacteriia bacterium]